MKSINQPIGYLHIFGQYTYHDSAQIKGTRLGLEVLYAAIKHALKYKEYESDAVFVNDGEGYNVLVECIDDAGKLDPPYIDQVVSHNVSQWMERAFKAEAEVSRLGKVLATQPQAPQGADAVRMREENEKLRAALDKFVSPFDGDSTDEIEAQYGLGTAQKIDHGRKILGGGKEMSQCPDVDGNNNDGHGEGGEDALMLQALRHYIQGSDGITIGIPFELAHAIMVNLECQSIGIFQYGKATVRPNSQDWAAMDGATAYHLIERHADGWDDIRLMMTEWLTANAAPPPLSPPATGNVGAIPVVVGPSVLCSICGLGRHVACHRPLLSGPNAGEPLDHAFTVGSVTLSGRVGELVAQHGTLRAAARVIDIDAGYLSRLASGEKVSPGKDFLRRMGLRRVTTYEKAKP